MLLENPLANVGLGVNRDALKDIFIPAKEFIFRYVYTIDPHDQKNPIKRVPQQKYVEDIIDTWLTEDLILIVKSRQMMISWVMVALNLWLARFHKGQYCFFVSKKEDDAGFSSPLSLLSRAWFIYEHLPEHLKCPVQKSLNPAMLKFPKLNSIIHGVSQDSDAVRQYTASSIFSDEMAFQERSEQIFAAVKPTIDGGGRFTGVSTPNGKRNLFYNLVHDVQK